MRFKKTREEKISGREQRKGTSLIGEQNVSLVFLFVFSGFLSLRLNFFLLLLSSFFFPFSLSFLLFFLFSSPIKSDNLEISKKKGLQ